MREAADVVVIGGAVMGSAVAYWLSEDKAFGGRVIVLEKDRSYQRAASVLSTSGVRQQFSSAVNVRLSRFTAEFLQEADLHLDVPGETSGVVLHEHGYLYLGGSTAVAAFEQNHALQRSLGVDVELMDRAGLARRFPWLTLDDVEIGSFGIRGEGWIDGHILMSAFKRRARANGVEYRYVEAVELLMGDGCVTGVRCSDGTEITAGHVVNASGGGGRAIAGLAGLDLPVINMKQMVYAFESPFSASGMPYVFTPDRLFFRPEGGHYIAGLGIETEDAGEDEDFDVDHAAFDEEV